MQKSLISKKSRVIIFMKFASSKKLFNYVTVPYNTSYSGHSFILMFTAHTADRQA
jgi:hypothetical protein